MNLAAAGAVFVLPRRIQQESYQWRGMDAPAAKILPSGWTRSCTEATSLGIKGRSYRLRDLEHLVDQR